LETTSLQVKKTEFAFADGQVICDCCKKTIPAGYPYAIRREVVVIENEYRLQESIECFVRCTDHRKSIRIVSDATEGVPAYSPVRKVTYPDCWENMPRLATEKERTIRILHRRTSRWLATGYARILELGVNGTSLVLECEPSQIMKSTFTRDKEKDDSYGFYQGWSTPEGFYCREYLQDDRDMIEGNWYLALQMLVWSEPMTIPKEWTENKQQRDK
jgi:hypothetical protein